MLLLVLFTNLRFMWRLRRITPVTAEQVTSLLERCKEEMGVYAPVSVVVTGDVSMPSLLGFVRPRILLPEGLLELLRPDQLRFILLHELAHVKRLDIVVGWVTMVLQAVHWFNPLVWYAAYRMQADREMACDAAVLTRAGKERADDYGGTIIALLERSSKRPRLVPAAALVETRAQLKRRITMIAQFRKTKPWLSAVAALILAGLAAVTLTNASQPPAHAQQAEPLPDLPDYVPATSTIGADGHIVDKVDWPFVNDPNVLGTWKSVDFVHDREQFKTGQKQFPDDLYLKGLTFLPNGRTQQVWRWTKGLLIHDGDLTASVYTIRSFNGEPYMFLEWKSGDYSIRRMRPSYYVLKKDLTAPEPATGAAAAMTDEAFRASKKQLVVQLVRNVDAANRETIAAKLGEPIQYIWGQSVFAKDNLPGCYIMQYPDHVDFWIRDGHVVEVRFYTPGWVFANGIQVGSTLDEVLQALGNPVETVVGQKNEFRNGVLYQDIDGRTGYCYYQRDDKDVRCFFRDYAVVALYVTRTDYSD
jgi:hypothetical protein